MQYKHVIILFFILVTWACNEYEQQSYAMIKNRMQTTFIGTQNGDGTGSFHNVEVNILSAGDSSVMVVGMFYDSLIVKIISINYSDGYVVARGDSIGHLSYFDKKKTLNITKYLTNYPFYTFSGRAKN